MIELIPAIDIIDGKCVRLSQGDYDTKKVYNENPLEVAKEFEANGIQRLHVVDLDGAKSSHVVNYKVLDAIAGHTSLTIDFGGGIKTDEDLVIAFENGAQMVTLGSVAVTGTLQEVVGPIWRRKNHPRGRCEGQPYLGERMERRKPTGTDAFPDRLHPSRCEQGALHGHQPGRDASRTLH